MAYVYDNKTYRNLQQQVKENMDNIAELQEMKLVGLDVAHIVETEADLSSISATQGMMVAVGSAQPYKLFVYNDSSWVDFGEFPKAGPQGEQGPQGEPGRQGPRGLTGPQGPRGYTGATGAQGPQGPSGERGPKGPQGPIGPQGPAGQDGTVSFDELTPSQIAMLKGPKGDTGAQGPQGQQGIQGPAGEQGIPGEQGPKGERGEQGLRGIQGPKGDRGDTGPQGIQGPKGENGDTGPEGPQGPMGQQGPKGDKGDTGAQGIQGPKGDKGDTGEQGPQGIQGPKGDKGDTGPEGPQGPIGPQGPKGDPGEVPQNVATTDYVDFSFAEAKSYTNQTIANSLTGYATETYVEDRIASTKTYADQVVAQVTSNMMTTDTAQDIICPQSARKTFKYSADSNGFALEAYSNGLVLQSTGYAYDWIDIRGTQTDCSISVRDKDGYRVALGNENGLDRGLSIVNTIDVNNIKKTIYAASYIKQNNYTYNLPNSSGTLALTSSIPTTTSALTNDSGFITNAALTGYATEDWVNQKGYLTSVSWGDIADKPTLVTTDTEQTITGKKAFGYLTSNNKSSYLNIGSMYENRLELSAYYPELIKKPFNAYVSTYTIRAAKEDTGGLGGYRNLKLVGANWDGIIIDDYGGSLNATNGGFNLGIKEGDLDRGYAFNNGYFTGTLQASSLTDGTTTKTMTEVLAGGGGSTTYMHVLKLSGQDSRSLNAWTTIYTKSETPFDKDSLIAWFTAKGLANFPANGSGKGYSSPLIIRNIKFGTVSQTSSMLNFEYISTSSTELNYDAVSSVEDTVVAVD